MYESEWAFYETHRDEFREKYLNKWLVITGDSLWGAYDRFHDAAKNAFEHFEPGEFMLHTPADDGKTVELGPMIQDAGDEPELESTMTSSGAELVIFPYDTRVDFAEKADASNRRGA